MVKGIYLNPQRPLPGVNSFESSTQSNINVETHLIMTSLKIDFFSLGV